VTQLVRSAHAGGQSNAARDDPGELIAHRQAKPGSLKLRRRTGIGNPLHLTMELLKPPPGSSCRRSPYRAKHRLNTA